MLFVATISFSLIGTFVVRRQANQKRYLLYEFTDGDIVMDANQTKNLVMISLVGGLVAGISGLGAPLILTPVMLKLGVHPQVTAETGNYITLFAASTNVLTVISLK